MNREDPSPLTRRQDLSVSGDTGSAALPMTAWATTTAVGKAGVVVAQFVIGTTAIEVGSLILRIECDRLSAVGNRRAVVAQAEIAPTAIAVGKFILRILIDRFRAISDIGG